MSLIVLHRYMEQFVCISTKCVSVCGSFCSNAVLKFSYSPVDQTVGRSINLALSYRGIQALAAVGLEEKVMANAIPMRSRMIHPIGKQPYTIPYGTRGECINSVDRTNLNELLLTAAESQPNVSLHFQHKLTRINFNNMTFTFVDSSSPTPKETVVKHDFVFGCDGAFSTVRRQIMRQELVNLEEEYIDHGYKELCIPAKDGEYAMPPNHLHIWAKGNYMMIALPNLDQSFTVTLFMPFDMFSEIETEEDVLDFFRQKFPDALPMIGEEQLVRDFFLNPTSPLISIKCFPHHTSAGGLLLGDAAHAMVPFYGQGMNCGFEDCLLFSEMLERNGFNFVEASKVYTASRCTDVHAICDLAMYNYLEMRSHVNSWSFLLKKKLDGFLHFLMPRTFIPLYTMVSFTRIPYATIVSRNRWQSKVVSRGLTLFGVSAFLLSVLLVHRYLPLAKWLNLPRYSISLQIVRNK